MRIRLAKPGALRSSCYPPSSREIEGEGRVRVRVGPADLRKLDVPDPHLYIQAPGGQCLRLVGIDEDLSFYEGAEEGPEMGKIKETLRRMSS